MIVTQCPTIVIPSTALPTLTTQEYPLRYVARENPRTLIVGEKTDSKGREWFHYFDGLQMPADAIPGWGISVECYLVEWREISDIQRNLDYDPADDNSRAFLITYQKQPPVVAIKTDLALGWHGQKSWYSVHQIEEVGVRPYASIEQAIAHHVAEAEAFIPVPMLEAIQAQREKGEAFESLPRVFACWKRDHLTPDFGFYRQGPAAVAATRR
jgi:hypothetical protein